MYVDYKKDWRKRLSVMRRKPLYRLRKTAKYIGEKMNTPYYNVLNMPLDVAYVFEAGNEKGGMKVEKYIPDFGKIKEGLPF